MLLRKFSFAVPALLTAATLCAQQAPAKPTPPEKPAVADPALDLAVTFTDHVVLLRCFCAGSEISFDAEGKPLGSPKTTDWTLAGVKLDHATRKSTKEIELDGVRVAMRFDQLRNEFEQHPQKDEKVRLLIADTGSLPTLSAALESIASFGIDPRLQRAMPPYWEHYFLPQTPWPEDGLGAGPGKLPPGAPPLTQPVLTHKQNAPSTPEAMRDHITGTVQLHFIVDTTGTPRRIFLQRPLGYGLDEHAVEAAEKLRFTAGMQAGKPVPAPVSLTEEFDLLKPQ